VWLDGFLYEGGGKFVDSFRYLYPTKEKAFTCWNTKLNARVNNYGTRIDYIIISNELTHALQDCIIMSDVHGSDHCPVKSSIALELIPSTKLPALCTKYFKEFSGKQLKMSTFVCKRTLTSVEQSNEIEKESEGSEPKKMRLSMKTTKQQQSSLLNYFSMGTTNSVKESVSNSNLSCDTSKLKGNEMNYP
jgi:AP endonuclease-2